MGTDSVLPELISKEKSPNASNAERENLMDALILPDALHGGPRRVSEYVNIADSGVPHQVKTAEWILRIALFGEFVGHGTFAFRAVPHFQELMAGALGITTEAAAVILPVVGVIDFTVAALALAKPIRLILLYAALWGLLTGIARPVYGTEIWAFVERWPNWAVPLALLYVRGFPQRRGDWLR